MRTSPTLRFDRYLGPSASGWRGQLDLLRLSLFGFIVVSVSVVQAYVGFIGVLRPGLVLWALAALGVLSAPRAARWESLTSTYPPKAMGVFAALAFLSIPFALSIGHAGTTMLDVHIRVLAFFVMLVVAIRSVRDLRFFIWAFVLSGAILGFLGMTATESFVDVGGTARLGGTHMYDPNDMGLVFLSAIPLALVLMETSRSLERWLALGCLALMGGAIAITASRGAFVGLMVVLPALFLVASHVSVARRLLVAAVLALGLVVAAPEGYWERMGTIFAPSDDYNVTDPYGRVEISKRGVGYMLQHPFLGVGVGNFPRAEGTISPLAQGAVAGRDPVRWIAPHNTFVQVGAELGMIALAIWLSFMVKGTVGLLRIRKRLRAWSRLGRTGSDARFLFLMSVYLPISFVGFASTSYFVSHAYTPIFYILVAFLTGTFIFARPLLHPAASPPVQGPPSARRPRRRRSLSSR